MFNVVLVEPEIPPNTGNVGRLCLATKSTLHLVKPLGFTLDDKQLQQIYRWIDKLPLSRPKKNIARDFSDGVLMAEVVKHFFPGKVEIHNYSTTNSVAKKLSNWDTLNQKVLKRLGFTIPHADVQAVGGHVGGHGDADAAEGLDAFGQEVDQRDLLVVVLVEEEMQLVEGRAVHLPVVDGVEVLHVHDVLRREEQVGGAQRAARVGDRRAPAIEVAGLGEAQPHLGFAGEQRIRDCRQDRRTSWSF